MPCRSAFSFAAALVCAVALTASLALAAGSVSYGRKEIKESGGGWNLMMTIAYGSVPPTPHVPLRFVFTPTVHYERYLDDAHKDQPQTRKIPLSGQMPLTESVDVDFADPRGKLYDRTKFDFTVTRSHNFEAGEYSVVVRRADGAQMGTAQTLMFDGDNPVIDRRTMAFVGNGPKKAGDKPAAADDKSAAAPAGGSGEGASAPASGGGDTPAAGAAEGAPSDEAASATDPAALEESSTEERRLRMPRHG